MNDAGRRAECLASVVGRSSCVTPLRVVMVGPFGLRPKATMSARALPLARELARRGHGVTLVLPPWSNAEDSGKRWEDRKVGRQEDREGESVHVVNVVLPTSPAPLFHAQLTQRLVQATLAAQPDVVHCFKPKAYSGLVQAALWGRRRAGRWRGRLILDTDDWEGAGGWNDLERYSWPLRQTFARQETWGLRHADQVTVASRALETLVWSQGVSRDRVVYLPNGAPLDTPPGDGARARARYGLGDAPVVLLYTRFFEFTVSRLLATFERILATVPHARLLVVGEGLFGEERELLTRLETWGRLSSLPSPRQAGKPAPPVVYAGWPGDAAMPDIFAATDVALYPLDDTLVNRTKSPAKLMQLVGAGVPVVADAVGQALVYVAPGRSGVLVPPGNVAHMAQATTLLLTNPTRRAPMSAAAQTWARAHYAWPSLAARLEAVYLGQTPANLLP